MSETFVYLWYLFMVVAEILYISSHFGHCIHCHLPVEKVEQVAGDCFHFCNKIWVTVGASDEGQALFIYFLNQKWLLNGQHCWLLCSYEGCLHSVWHCVYQIILIISDI